MYLKEQLSPCLFPEIFYQQIQKLPRKGKLPFYQVTLTQHRSRIMKIALRQMVVHSKRFHILDDIKSGTLADAVVTVSIIRFDIIRKNQADCFAQTQRLR